MLSRLFQNTNKTQPVISETEVQQLQNDLRQEMIPVVVQQLKQDLRLEIEMELKKEFIETGGLEKLKESLREEILPSVREQAFHDLRAQLEPTIQSDLINELRNSETLSNEREKVRIELKAELLQSVNHELESLRKSKFDELSNKLKLEIDTLRVAKRNGFLLSHFKEAEIEKVKKIATDEIKKELTPLLRIQLEPIVRSELIEKIGPEVYNNLAKSEGLNKLALNELKESLRVQAKNELKEELEVVVKKEIFDSVTQQIRPEIESRIRAELTPSIIEAIAADNDNSLASLLQQAKMYLQEKLDRELTDRADKIARNLILNIAHEGKIEEGNVEALLSGLRDCAEANASPGGFSHTGFLKAEEKMSCVRTGEVIEKRDFYIVIGGRPHSLPNSYGEAANLAKLAYYEEKKKFKKTYHQFIGDSDFRDSNNNPLQQDRSTHEISEDDLSI